MPSKFHALRFQALILPELGYLRRLGLALAGNRPACDDLVQQSVLRGLRYFESYKGDDFRPWMAAILRNVHRDKPRMTIVSTGDQGCHATPDRAPDPEAARSPATTSCGSTGLWRNCLTH